MELTILKEKEIPLLERKRVSVSIASQSGKTPSRLAVLKDAAKLLKTKEENIVIRHVYSKFGTGASKAILHVYKNKATKEKFEAEYLLKKHVGEEKPAEEAAPAPAAEAAPVEEPKAEEAAPAEEKPAEEVKEAAAPAEEAKEEPKAEEEAKKEA